MTDHLFLYGTLLPAVVGPPCRDHVARLRPVGRGWVPGRLYNLGWYPGAVLDPSAATRVHGEVFALPDDPTLLAALDVYEGFDANNPAGSWFLRIRHPITLDSGGEVACWLYVCPREPAEAPQIACGDYLRWRAGGETSAGSGR